MVKDTRGHRVPGRSHLILLVQRAGTAFPLSQIILCYLSRVFCYLSRPGSEARKRFAIQLEKAVFSAAA